MRSLVAVAVAGALAVVAASSCRRAPTRPNVLVITVDTLRADHLGCYGFGLANTPAIDELASEGVRCADATTSAPITLPAHCSMMTGLYPPAHGVRDNGNYALGAEAVTLAERLGSAGYRTAAFVSAAVLARRYGLDQGFTTYDDDLWSEDQPELFMIRDRPASRTAARTIAWLESWQAHDAADPFFVWMHLFDPHQPYHVTDYALGAMAPTAYDAEIAQADRGVGEVIDWLRRTKRLDDTVVVFTADHGESLGEHGEPTHGIFIYDATIHVPMIWRFPRLLKPATYPGPVRHIDIVPTVLAMVGIGQPDTLQGVDLLPAFEGRVPPPDLPQYSEARLAEEGFGMAPLFGLRQHQRKWIQAPKPELYDLKADPGELTNRYPAEAASADDLTTALDGVFADSAHRALVPSTRAMDRETEDMLRALGYLAPPEQRAEMAGMDPKDGMPIYVAIQEARGAAQNGQWERVGKLLDPIVAASPENVTARNILAFAATRQGDMKEAEREYRASLEYQPNQHRVYGALGGLALARGDLDQAEVLVRRALELAPTFVEGMSNMGFIAALRGDQQTAESWYQRAIALDPTYPHVYRRFADLYYDREDWTHAAEYYRRVLALLPAHFEVLIQAGNAARFLDDPAGAERDYDEAARVRPDSWVPPYNIACLRALQGNPQAALDLLERAVDLGFRHPRLLDENDDFATLRGLPEWSVLVERASIQASLLRS
ncbi:MAG TPA: sulfatase-like hydrolase/transferase [Candidatus Binatia bacterium]|jgi:arylsulfatase A-like enzyme/Flp pilus assembly protein TadD|nr:sulfatase-like hydrolase/transferase [Candidatus Binatia bacterium]